MSRISSTSRRNGIRAPLIVHCWMKVSRSPAAAVVVALSLKPDQSEEALARRLRAASPYRHAEHADHRDRRRAVAAMDGW